MTFVSFCSKTNSGTKGNKGNDEIGFGKGRNSVFQQSFEKEVPGLNLLHIVHDRPGSAGPRDLGPVSIQNPNYTEFVDKDGKPLPMHHGIVKLPDGTTTTKYVNLGCAQTSDGRIYSLALVPYTLLQVDPPK